MGGRTSMPLVRKFCKQSKTLTVCWSCRSTSWYVCTTGSISPPPPPCSKHTCKQCYYLPQSDSLPVLKECVTILCSTYCRLITTTSPWMSHRAPSDRERAITRRTNPACGCVPTTRPTWISCWLCSGMQTEAYR